MKKYLLPDTVQYKANLHCHSTFSDGRFTVEQHKENYLAHGYSIVAFSDHNKLVPHVELKDERFLPITSLEIDMTERFEGSWLNARTYHLNFFSADETRTEFIPVERAYDVDVANDMIRRAHEAGFLSQYNHPRWSLQSSPDYIGLEGLDLFEVFNTGCEKEMFNGYGDREYEQILIAGKYPCPSATDDNHNACQSLDSPYNDSFGGFDMICMPKLEYGEFFKAVKNGDMYASTGPVINSLYYEDGKVYLECSPCSAVVLRTESRASRPVRSFADDITSAVFDINFNYDWKYVRFECHDIKGRAFTRAYLKEELLG